MDETPKYMENILIKTLAHNWARVISIISHWGEKSRISVIIGFTSTVYRLPSLLVFNESSNCPKEQTLRKLEVLTNKYMLLS